MSSLRRSLRHWLCLDPDENRVSHLRDLIAARELPACCEAKCGVLADLLATNMRIQSSILMCWSISKMTKERCALLPIISRPGATRNALASLQLSLQPL